MTARLELWIIALLVTVALTLSGYFVTSALGATLSDYDLIIEDIPVNFDDNKTMYLDTRTNDRAFIIYNDQIRIRSHYLTFWDFNESYEHEDICYVTGAYAYAHIPAENLTLNSVTGVSRFNFFAWNGTVGVQCSEYSTNHMTLQINSTDNATLLIRPMGLTHGYEYRVLIDGNPVGWKHVNADGYFDYNYTGDWSNHTVGFTLIGRVVQVPSIYLGIIQLFLYLGVFVVVTKQMILPMREKHLKTEEITKRFIKAAVYIVTSLALISLVFKLFVGV